MPSVGLASGRVVACDIPGMPLLARVLDALGAAIAAQGCSFVRFASPQELAARRESVLDCDVFAGFGGMALGADIVAQSRRLRGLVSHVSGTEGFPVATATEHGMVVAHAPTPENVQGMAEVAVLLMLHLCYDLDAARADLRTNRPRPPLARGGLLSGKTIGLVGYGRIAQRVTGLLASWGATIRVYSRRGASLELPAHATACGLDALLAESDIVCVLAGAEAQSGPLIGREQIGRMKPSAHLVNIARGSLVDEAALVDALAAGAIAGAALDVFAVEPLPLASPLRELPNVILTPHRLGHTRELEASLAPALIENVSCLLQGRLPPMVRNPGVATAWLQRWGGHRLV